jgi:signal transduction histidine kinase/ligand-binding sensor domain-containing protein
MRRCIRLLFLAAAAAASRPASAGAILESNRSKFTHLSIEQGLSNNIVNCVLQDRKGFLWIGTDNGLNRFDGYRFTVFTSDPARKESIAYNVIEVLFEDREGVLWIGTENGLSRFDRETETFSTYRNDPADTASLSHNNVYCIQQDSSGLLWVGTFGGGLNALNPRTGKFVRYRADRNNPKSLSHDIIRSLYLDRRDRLWVGTDEGGLNLFERGTGTFIRYRHDPNNPNSLSHNVVMAIREDASGGIWIGTWGGGLDRLEPSLNRFVHHRNDPGSGRSLGSDIITRLYTSRSGDLWIGTWNDGLKRLSAAGLKNRAAMPPAFDHFVTDRDDPESLSANTVWSLTEDQTGAMWIGTDNGLNQLNSRRKKFDTYRAMRGNGRGLPGDNVQALFADREGRIWAGTRENGFSRLDPSAGTYVHYRPITGSANSPCRFWTMAFAEGPAGVYWTGTDGGGIDRFDSRSGVFRHYRHDPGNPNSLSNDYVFQLLFEEPATLWVGTFGGAGLSKMDTRTGRWTHYPFNTAGFSKNIVRKLFKDRSGNLWIGTDDQGLICFHPKTGVMERFRHDPARPASLSQNTVLSIYEDERKNLWIGTAGGGLNRFDPRLRQFFRYDIPDRSSGGMICGILEDDRGNLWISTDKGLSKFDRLRNTFKIYDKSDGLQDNVFNPDACCRLKSGRLCFGGVGGFNIFHPDSIMDNPFVPEVVFSNLTVLNRKVSTGDSVNGRVLLPRALDSTGEIVLRRRENVFSIEFAALHYADPAKNRYAYMLEGFDDEWIYADARDRTATYTNLDPRVYTFKVKASNNDGIWNETPAMIRIRVLPYFWQTLTFKFAAGFGLILLVAASALLRERRIRSRRESLDRLIRERTAELNARTEELVSANRRLSEANDLLQTANIEHNRSQKLLHHAVTDLKRSNDELAQFAYIASHDLQEPLRMVASYVSLLSRRYQGKLDPQADEFIAFAVEGSRRMQQLINDLLSYSRITTKGKPFQSVDVEALLERVVQIMQITIRERRARITHDPLPRVTGDPIQIEQLLQNLISNGIKYCKADNPAIHISMKRMNGEFRFSVRDNGIGIAAEHQEKIFGIFQRLHSREEYGGTGIGLAICRKIVERHGGKIWLESEENTGSTFFFTMPAA